MNARSMVNKQPEIATFIAIHHPDILLVTETWLHEDINEAEIQVPGYRITRQDRQQGIGGGCVIYAKDYIQMIEETLGTGVDTEPFIQMRWVRIRVPQNEFLLGICYNSPQSNMDQIELMNQVITEACRVNKKILLCGDFNFPGINWKTLQSNKRGRSFLQTTLDNFLHQHIEVPTRGENTLDLVLSSDPRLISNIQICDPLKNSDHCTIKFAVNLSSSPQVWKTKCLNYRRGDYKGFSRFLINVDWDGIFNSKDTNAMWRSFCQVVQEGVRSFIPTKKNANLIAIGLCG